MEERRMTRLIDADEIIKRSHDVILKNGAKHRCFDTTMIYEIPTLDAEPIRHGRWVYSTTAESVDYEYSCSNCGYSNFADVIQAWDYCPQCGTKMDVGGDLE